MLQVVCVKVGDKYGPEWVNRLFRAVSLHLSLPHDFACLTDDPIGIDCRIIRSSRPDLEGWWQKVALFGPQPYVSDRIAYLDLDTVVTGSLDEIFSNKAPFLAVKDRQTKGMSSTLMLWDHATHRYIYDDFKSPDHIWGDQGYIGGKVTFRHANELWPGRVVSYKEDLKHSTPKGGEWIIYFHGQPSPSDVDWVQNIWRQQRQLYLRRHSI